MTSAFESLVSFGYGVLNSKKALSNGYIPINISELEMPMLIIAPHPDDEWLSSAGLISEASKIDLSSVIDVLVMSKGEAYTRIDKKWSKHNKTQLSEERRMETILSLAYLTKNTINPMFLEFKDGKIADPFIHNDTENILFNFNVMRNSIMKKNYGTYIFPFIFDDNSDHWGSALYTILAIYSLSLGKHLKTANSTFLMYLTHFYNYPIRGTSNKLRNVFPPFAESGLFSELILSNESYKDKRSALKFFKSQNIDFGNSIMLRDFIKHNEPFVKLNLKANPKLSNITYLGKQDSDVEYKYYNFIFSNEGVLEYIDTDNIYSFNHNHVSITLAKGRKHINVSELKIETSIYET